MKVVGAALKQAVHELCTVQMLGCLFVALVVFSMGIVNNAYLYATVVNLFPAARECAALFEAMVYVALFCIAFKRPSLLRGSTAVYVTIVVCVAIMPMLCYAFYASNAALTTVGLCLRSFCRAVLQLLLLLALLELGNVRSVALVVLAGVFGSRLAEPLLRTIPSVYVAVCIIAVTYVCALIVGFRLCEGTFANVFSAGPQRSRESFSEALRSAKLVKFVTCVLMFCIATGYARCLKGIQGAAAPTGIEVSIVVLVAFVYLFMKKDDFVDGVFSLSVVLVFAGFLFVPVTIHGDSTIANTCLTLGGCCFEVLLWMLLVGVGARNPLLLVPMFALTHFTRQAGTVIGAVAANVSMALYQTHTSLPASFALGCAFAFFVFLWVGFRDFNFSQVIFGVREESLQDVRESIAVRCQELGDEFGLTARERDVLELLARGRNTAFIMETLVLSKNTVKSHVKHIYTKLDVHSHQELLDLFE